MTQLSIDQMVFNDHWSDLRQFRKMPEIDLGRLQAYRMERIKSALREAGAAMCMLVNPISLRYAVNYRTYGLFQSHIPLTYLFVPVDGPVVIYGGYGDLAQVDDARQGQPISYFGGGPELKNSADQLAEEIVLFLKEIGSDNRRVAVEYVNPGITQALMRRDIEVIDGVDISESARVIKSDDEIECIRWAIAVAEHGIAKLKQAMRPGVTELQLWALLNYTNLANNGDWHEGRMLASGPRINPWLQEASEREIEAGDLVGLDTDMVGPMGYFADISRTFFCGPGKPSPQQKRAYRLAYEEVQHNLKLVQPGISFSEFQEQAYPVPEAFQPNAYPCIMHGVGMCDEYPYVRPGFRGPVAYDGKLEPGMVICVESYMGARGERDGVKLEQQVLVTDDGYQMLTTYPYENDLLD